MPSGCPKACPVLGTDVHRTFLICGVSTIFLWFLYPISWGLSEGGNVFYTDSEAAFYVVLDIMAKPVFGALVLWGHRNIDPATLRPHIRDYEDDVGTTRREKGITGTSAANNSVVTDAPATTV
jgi:bacteriorhodopsin